MSLAGSENCSSCVDRRFLVQSACAFALTFQLPTRTKAGYLPARGDAFHTASPRFVTALQLRLKALGVLTGPANGNWDARTRKAFEQFCRDRGLPTSIALQRGHFGALWNIEYDPDRATAHERVEALRIIFNDVPDR
jgi:hypothetical protein